MFVDQVIQFFAILATIIGAIAGFCAFILGTVTMLDKAFDRTFWRAIGRLKDGVIGMFKRKVATRERTGEYEG